MKSLLALKAKTCFLRSLHARHYAQLMGSSDRLCRRSDGDRSTDQSPPWLLLSSSSIFGGMAASGELFAAASIDTGLRSGWDRAPRGIVLGCFE